MPAAVTNSCSVRGWYVAASGCGCVHAPDGVVLIISMACTMFHPGHGCSGALLLALAA